MPDLNDIENDGSKNLEFFRVALYAAVRGAVDLGVPMGLAILLHRTVMTAARETLLGDEREIAFTEEMAYDTTKLEAQFVAAQAEAARRN